MTTITSKKTRQDGKKRPLQLLRIVCLTVLCAFFVCALNSTTSLGAMRGFANTIYKASPTILITRPFPMPIQGDNYHIFQPLYDMNPSLLNEPILSAPKILLDNFEARVSWVDTMIANPPKESKPEYAQKMYLEMMRMFLSGLVFDDAEGAVGALLGKPPSLSFPYSADQRALGLDCMYLGDTMTGTKRLNNVRDLLTDVIQNNIEGDYIETGVWRGGSSVFARAVITMLGQEEKRISYVCDSFAGLPPGDKKLDAKDVGWTNTRYLEVPSEIVANNFNKFGLLDSNVVFAKGFFNETMPPLSKHIKKLSVMRLDGDLYESTVDVLYHLYDKLSIGGYVIMDDWSTFPSRTACEDFFKVHGISPDIIAIDPIGAYWKKTEEVDIQMWRYEQSKFKAKDKKE